LKGRTEFLGRIALFAAKFGVSPVPRPPYWTGIRVVPNRIEFWKGMPFRLHERTLYEKSADGWSRTLLYP
jgi:pyridoxamine 5'-phosphate oxidase